MSPLPVDTKRVLFDISRLYRNRNKAFGTGVDRIDLCIALDLRQRFGHDCHFVYAGLGGFCILPQAFCTRLLEQLDIKWGKVDGNGKAVPLPSLSARIRALSLPLLYRLNPRGGRTIATEDTTYVVASHSGMGRVKGALKRLDPQFRMKRVVYIHDLIPLDYPEYQRPETLKIFTRYLAELTAAPVFIVANSHDTAVRAQAYAKNRKWRLTGMQVVVPTLEFSTAAKSAVREDVRDLANGKRPYFVILGTVEPRKNHLLLLNIWRELAEEREVPHLCIVGRRGWENENVVDMLDRCPGLRGHVSEFSNLTDTEVQTLLAGAQALLFPSFAEGLGIPILEAAALNIPCVVSDIPVFREIAPPGTIFLHPLDGIGWKNAILSRMEECRDRTVEPDSNAGQNP